MSMIIPPVTSRPAPVSPCRRCRNSETRQLEERNVSLIDGLGRSQFAVEGMASPAIAMTGADLFYRFGSLTLERCASLGTWASSSWTRREAPGLTRWAGVTKNARKRGD